MNTDALDDRLIPLEGKLDALKFDHYLIQVFLSQLRLGQSSPRKFPDYKERAKYVLGQTLAALPISD